MNTNCGFTNCNLDLLTPFRQSVHDVVNNDNNMNHKNIDPSNVTTTFISPFQMMNNDMNHYVSCPRTFGAVTSSCVTIDITNMNLNKNNHFDNPNSVFAPTTFTNLGQTFSFPSHDHNDNITNTNSNNGDNYNNNTNNNKNNSNKCNNDRSDNKDQNTNTNKWKPPKHSVKSQCPQCFQWYCSTYIDLHIRKHTGEQPHLCYICRKPFAYKPNLLRHIKQKHTNDRPHKCHICPKGFVSFSDLARHIRTHTKEKPYRCFYCETNFSEKGNLKAHVARIHRNDILNDNNNNQN